MHGLAARRPREPPTEPLRPRRPLPPHRPHPPQAPDPSAHPSGRDRLRRENPRRRDRDHAPLAPDGRRCWRVSSRPNPSRRHGRLVDAPHAGRAGGPPPVPGRTPAGRSPRWSSGPGACGRGPAVGARIAGIGGSADRERWSRDGRREGSRPARSMLTAWTGPRIAPASPLEPERRLVSAKARSRLVVVSVSAGPCTAPCMPGVRLLAVVSFDGSSQRRVCAACARDGAAAHSEGAGERIPERCFPAVGNMTG